MYPLMLYMGMRCRESSIKVKYSNDQPIEASSDLKSSHRHSATHTALPTTHLHHKSLFKSLSLYLHGSLYLISCLPSHMAYIQQEKAFRFSRIRVFHKYNQSLNPVPEFWI